MCGIAGIAGPGWSPEQLTAMVSVQNHRGPDDRGLYRDESGKIGLGHNRLSIIDLSPAGHQPMCNHNGSLWVVFNGEIYNYLELRSELNNYPYRSQTDTEVVLAAYERWREACLERFIGMFAFILWDSRRNMLFAARDRFGVKPLYYAHLPSGALALASEIKALHACGISRVMDPVTWATYLTYGVYDHSERTFWEGIHSLPPGHALSWQERELHIWKWYDLSERVPEAQDTRPISHVMEEYRALLEDSVRLRFRADVSVGINLSGGVDSSALLGLVQAVQGRDSTVSAFTFVTGDERYDELPWVKQMLARTRHPHHICRLSPEEVPELAARVQQHEDEPFGGLPTIAYSKVFARARQEGVIVLLDGQGLDEQWAGYDYYARVLDGTVSNFHQPVTGPVQGSNTPSTRSECLIPEFRARAVPFAPSAPFSDALCNLQYRDARYTKIPRALRFNDRISMMHSTELREPFLDQRLFELALCQPPERKVRNGTHKWLLRQVVQDLLPQGVVEAPKRPLQTPQREWLRGPLKGWADDCIEAALAAKGGEWLDKEAVRSVWRAYQHGEGDNSSFIWQWVSLGLIELAN